MALPIDVTPYTLQSVMGGDSFLTHYKATDVSGDDYIITEYYPTYMVASRSDEGHIQITEQFVREYTDNKDDFVKRSLALKELNDPSIHPVQEVFEKNNTAYLVRKVCGLTYVEHYMGTAQMDCDEAFRFMRPLFVSTATVAEYKLFFNIRPEDLRVNSLRQLVCCATPTWDADFTPTLKSLIKLYYRLVSGVEPAEENPAALAVFGLSIPPRVETVVMNVLKGEILYGSLDDFYKSFKNLIEGVSDTPAAKSGKTLNSILQAAAAVLLLVLVGASFFLVQGAVNVYRAGSFWADPAIFADGTRPPPSVNDFTGHGLVHPVNAGDVMNSSFAIQENFMFMRHNDGMLRRLIADMITIPGATGVLAAAEDIIIHPGIVPSSITGIGNYIYFSDINQDGVLFRSHVNGTELEQLTNFPVLHSQIVNGILYFAKGDSDFNLYWMDLDTLDYRLLFELPVRSTAVIGNRLYLLAGEGRDSGLFVLDTSNFTVERIADGVGNDLRTFQNQVYFLDNEGYINTVDMRGIVVRINGPGNVRSFDVFFQWIAYTENYRHSIRVFNMDNNEFYQVSPIEWVSYVWIYNGFIYSIDHRSPTTVRVFPIPNV